MTSAGRLERRPNDTRHRKMRLKWGCVTWVGSGGWRHLRPLNGVDSLLAQVVRWPSARHRSRDRASGVRGRGEVGRSMGRTGGSVGYGPQPIVELPAPQGQALVHHAEAPAVVERDGGVEAAPAVELHAGPEPVDAGGHRGGESVDAGHRVHPADEQREPLPGRGRDSHEVRRSSEAERPGGFADTAGRQVLPLARRQVCRAVVHPSHDAFGQEGAQGSVDRGVRLAEDVRQLRRIDEWRPAEGVEQLSFGERQVRVLISWVVPQLFKGSNGFALLLRYLVLSPVGHMSTHQSLEESPVVRNP